MELSQILSPNRILVDVEVTSKDELFDKLLNAVMVTHFTDAYPLLSLEYLKNALYEREVHKSTSIGRGLAVPHARLENFPETLVAMARLKTPLAWEEEKPEILVDTVCMVFVNREAPSEAIRISAQFAKYFADEVNRVEFKAASSADAIVDLFRNKNLDFDQAICAREIMRAPLVCLTKDMPLRRAATIMMRHRFDEIGVLDEEGRIIGELSCDNMFRSGLPDFFGKLKSVSFIREFDPFEGYFAEESSCTVGDMMSEDFCSMGPDATIMEIVFALGVKKHPKIWVIENDKLIGVIDRIALLRNVIL